MGQATHGCHPQGRGTCAGPQRLDLGGVFPRGMELSQDPRHLSVVKQVLEWMEPALGRRKQAACSPQGELHTVRNLSREPIPKIGGLGVRELQLELTPGQQIQRLHGKTAAPARSTTCLSHTDQCLQVTALSEAAKQGQETAGKVAL